MRGPGYKLTGDVRRTWRCPACGAERKRMGDITSLQCGCQAAAWMQIVAERIIIPRPIQRPSDIERHPIDFGIEPPPPAPVKPEATIVKSATFESVEETVETKQPDSESSPPAPNDVNDHPEDDWGEGIL